ncbi:TRAP transporter permease [Pyramidobacter piscolens]|uniref:TRAP transporter, 4TM/12TM fusion protein n=1 Tax=Pyramidobacter piscolens W5455 TaxID=352165 RepID=A0ABP2HTQ9_9BACT|nr:TRAP transporter fused permease subunit [Pyramidobacter piscolens]EFB90531.1 TRAP transporter, 4TM/12TM fusion protein [Pyramidobacter piscolens W5455]BDF79534.1 ATP-binding protein [Pyramidobacter piscolens]
MSLKKLSDKLILLVGAILTLFQIYTAATMPFPGMQQRSIHLGLGLALVFLVKSKAKKPEHQDLALLLGIILAVVSLVACFNVTWQWLDMAEPMRLTFPETEDFVFGTTLILLVLFGTCKVTGIAMPLIAIFFLAYAYFGKHVPIAMFRHPGVRFSQLISMGYMGTEGIFSSILGVSTNQVFIFLLFGQLLDSLGGGAFFLDLANSGFGRVRGGPAKVSIFGSALFGSISGSAVANVVATGTITIPLMQEVGYTPVFAGAVSAVASTGGLIMPPVMGAAAFIMADILGIPYWDVCKAAAIPAILYYLALYLCVDFRAASLNMRGLPENEIPKFKDVIKKGGFIYITPLVLLVYVLGALQYPADKACFYCCCLLIVLSLTKKKLRKVLAKDWLTILVKTARSSMTVIMACSCAGLILLALQTSGLILKLANILVALAGGRLWLLLILVMLCSIIMGMGLPASACYIILAILGAPAIVSLGVPPVAAHLFVLFFGSMSAITPPVAMAAFAAAPIAKASSARIGYAAWWMGLPAFLIAFCMVFQPALVMIGSLWQIGLAVFFCVAGVFCMTVGLQGYFLSRVSVLRRVIWIVAGVMLIAPETISSVIGLVIGVVLYFVEKTLSKKAVAA